MTGLIEFIYTLPENTVMAEIGCYAGESTAFFAKRVFKVYCIDFWQDYLERLHNSEEGNFIDCTGEAEKAFELVMQQYPNIVKIKGTSIEMAKKFDDGFFDVVYIDANHEKKYILSDIQAWLPKVKKNGIISGHDYSVIGVGLAVREVFGGPDRTFADDSWMKQLHG
jgi:predicted O-methyltransferase YrrM